MLKIVVVGGGFYGLWISTQLSNSKTEVTVIEKNSELMGEASMINQARVHNGHHYPRSYSTFASSNRNYDRFLKEFSSTIDECHDPIYLISDKSKVDKMKFERLCNIFQVKLQDIPIRLADIYKLRYITKGWKVNESYFNSRSLKQQMLNQLDLNGVKIIKNSEVISIEENHNIVKILRVENGQMISESFNAAVISTYGNIEMLKGGVNMNLPRLNYQVSEIVNVRVPDYFNGSSITVIDGPFWSLTPWPAFGNFALSHVRYTPLANFKTHVEAKQFMEQNIDYSNFNLMKKDLIKYHKIFDKITKIKSYLAIKCLLPKSESNDSRPILYKFNEKGNILLTIGGKIDNIFDLSKVLCALQENIGVSNE